MSQQIEITYRARGSRPSVDLDLHLATDGQVEVFIGSSTTLPMTRLNRIGTFAGSAPTSNVEAINAFVSKHDLVAHAGTYGQVAPSTPNRYLALSANGNTAEFQIGESPENATIDQFEQLLQQLALAMTEQPLRAVKGTLKLTHANGDVAPSLELRSIGSEPMTVLLFDPEKPVFTLYIQVELHGTKTLPHGVSFPVSAGTIDFPIETVQARAASGDLPSGIAKLPPDTSYRFDLPPIAAPADVTNLTATGSFSFWLPEGLARRELTLLTPAITLP